MHKTRRSRWTQIHSTPEFFPTPVRLVATMTRPKTVMLAGARTPMGSYPGVLKDVAAHELGAALKRSNIAADAVDEVIAGCVASTDPTPKNARRVGIAAGLDHRVPALTVNHLCGAGLQAIWSGAQELLWGGVDTIVTGGNESTSRTPFLECGMSGSCSQPAITDETAHSPPRAGQHSGNAGGVVRCAHAPTRSRPRHSQ